MAEDARRLDVRSIGFQDIAGQTFRFVELAPAQRLTRRLDRIGDGARSREWGDTPRHSVGRTPAAHPSLP